MLKKIRFRLNIEHSFPVQHISKSKVETIYNSQVNPSLPFIEFSNLCFRTFSSLLLDLILCLSFILTAINQFPSLSKAFETIDFFFNGILQKELFFIEKS